MAKEIKDIASVRKTRTLGFRLSLLVSAAIILFGIVSIWFVAFWQESSYKNEKRRQWSIAVDSLMPNLANALSSDNSDAIKFTLDRLASKNEDIRSLVLADEKGRVVYSLDEKLVGKPLDEKTKAALSETNGKEEKSGLPLRQYSREIKTEWTSLGRLYAGFAVMNSLEKERQRSILALEYMIDNAVRNAVLSFDFYEADHIAHEIVKNVDDVKFFKIVAADGVILSSSDDKETLKQTEDARLSEILASEGVNRPVWTRMFKSEGARILEVTLVMIEGNEKLGAIQIGYDISSLSASVKRRNAILVLLSAAAVAIAAMIAIIIAGRISRPVAHLSHVALQVGAGDLDARAEVSSGGDEMRLLGSAFNKMIAGLKERDLIKDTFSRYVTKQVADEILKDPAGVSLGGVKREATILFSDIRGFTAFAERHEPEDVIARLNEYLAAMVDVIFKYEGTLDKFIGDAIMAVYGSPISREDDPLRAAMTALEMRERLQILNEKWAAEGREPLKIGIGINAGEVIAGNIGDVRRMEYTVIGDNVNLASRIEGLTKIFDCPIIISGSVFEKIKDRVVAVKLESTFVKGKTLAVEIYELKDLAR